MWAVFVVIDQPLMSDRLNLFEVCKQMAIEHFSSVGPVKALYKSILIRFAWLDISDGNAFTGSPFCKRSRNQFRPDIQASGAP